MKFLILFTFSLNAYAFTLNTNNDSKFKSSVVKIWITQNSTCSNIGYSSNQILDMAIDGATKFWNRVPSSNFVFKKGGVLKTSNSNFISGKLCVDDSVTFCDESNSIPSVNEIVIACNTNEADNFLSSNIYALTAPRSFSNGNILGSVILLNDTNSTALSEFSKDELINIIAHELGHAIGIGHSEDPSALMYSYYNKDRVRLGIDDMDALTYLYPNKLDGCTSIVGSVEENNNKGIFLYNVLFGFIILMILNLVFKCFKRYLRIA